MSEPLMDAARELADGSFAGIRRAVEGAPAEALNWCPAGDDTNTIAVLTVHALHSTRWWLSVATGASAPERDRPSEFEATASSAGELEAFVDSIAQDCRSLLAVRTIDPGASRTSRPAYGPPETVTAAWALLHALEHLREHVAHLQLTRQLWDLGGGNAG
jgi:DinB family protein